MAQMTMPDRDSKFWPILNAVVGILVATTMSFTGYMVHKVDELSSSVQVIRENMAQVNGNRFTSNDGLLVWKEISGIRERLASIPPKFPPEEYRTLIDTRFGQLQTQLDRVDKLVQENNTMLQQLNGTVNEMRKSK